MEALLHLPLNKYRAGRYYGSAVWWEKCTFRQREKNKDIVNTIAIAIATAIAIAFAIAIAITIAIAIVIAIAIAKKESK